MAPSKWFARFRLPVAITLLLFCGNVRGDWIGDLKFMAPGASTADSEVVIRRNASDQLEFRDKDQTTTVTLSTLVTTGITDHGALTGLADDDHSIYYNAARHGITGVHVAAFNNSLPITGDVGGNGTVGAHVADADYHFLLPSGVYEVDSAGTREYATITAAASAANAAGGGTLLVWPGTYAEFVALGANVNLMGITGRSEETIIQMTTQGVSVLTAAGGNYIKGVTIYNAATAATQNMAVQKTGTGNLKLEHVTLKQGGGWGVLSSAYAGTIHLRNCDFTGGDKQVYATGLVCALDSYFARTDSGSAEILSIRSASQGWLVANCIFQGNANMVGFVKFYTAPGALRMRNCVLYGGAEIQVFQSGTAAGAIQYSGVNAMNLGGISAPIADARYDMLGHSFSTEVKLRPLSGGAVPLQFEPQASYDGRLMEGRDANGTLVCWIDDDGTYWPDSSGSYNRLTLMAESGFTTECTKQRRTSAAPYKYELEYTNASDCTTLWPLVGEDIDTTTETLYVSVYFEAESNAGAVVWDMGTCNYPSGAVLNQAMTWDAGNSVTPAGTAVLSVSPEFEITPDWGTSESDLVSFALRRDVSDANTGTVNVFAVRLRWQR